MNELAAANRLRDADVPRRRRRRTALLAALVVLAVPATAAGMEAAGIHTGIFPAGGAQTEHVPGEELLNIDSPDPTARRKVEESWIWRYSRGSEMPSSVSIEQVFIANCA